MFNRLNARALLWIPLLLAGCAASRTVPAPAPVAVSAQPPAATPMEKPVAAMAPQSAPQAPPDGVVKPIFSQLLRLTYPAGFRQFKKEESDSRYQEQLGVANESLAQWSSLMTVSGIRALADKPGMTSQLVAEEIQARFKQGCPASYTGKTLSDGLVNGAEVNVSVFGCGRRAAGTSVASETSLLIVLRGEHDFYTVQWAERGAPAAGAPKLELARWIRRYRELGPVRLCPRVAGETAPYASCL